MFFNSNNFKKMKPEEILKLVEELEVDIEPCHVSFENDREIEHAKLTIYKIKVAVKEMIDPKLIKEILCPHCGHGNIATTLPGTFVCYSCGKSFKI